MDCTAASLAGYMSGSDEPSKTLGQRMKPAENL